MYPPLRPTGAVHDRPADGRTLRIVLAGLLAAGLLVVALRGGSYDSIPRSEAFIVAWWILGLAAAFGVLPRRRWSPAVRVGIAALLALAAWTALGLLWTDSAERTVEEVMRVLGYVGLAILVASFFGGRDLPLVVGVLTVLGGVVCVLALTSRLAPEVLSSALAEAGYAPSRLDFPFNYWNSLGCWAAMTLALALALSVHAGERWLQGVSLLAASVAPVTVYLTYSRTATVSVVLASALVVALSSRRWLAAANAAIVAVVATGVVLVIRASPEIARGTGTAGREAVAAAIALAGLVAVAAGLMAPRDRLARMRIPPRTWWRRIVPAGGAAILVAAAIAGPQLAGSAWRSFERPETQLGSDPAQRLTSLGGTRITQWEVAMSVFAREPLHGVGAGTFEYAWNRDRRRTGHVIDAHSLYIESLAELGLPGAILVVLAFGALLAAAIRSAVRPVEGIVKGAAVGGAAALAVFALTAGVDWMWESTAIVCFALVVGTVAAAGHAAPVGRLRRPLRAGVALVAAVAVMVQMPPLLAATQLRSSQEATRQGRFVDALSDATTATRSEPWGASAQLQRALVLERLGQLGSATEAAQRATRLEPTNWELWLVLGRIQAEAGRLTPALASVARARTLNPRSPLFQPGVAKAIERRGGG